MTVKDADTLKSYFALSKVPVPSQYVDLIDTIFDQGSGEGGDHDHDDRYVQLSIPNNILAVHTFNPSIYGSPFLLGPNAQGQTVSGLKADQLNKTISVSGLGLSGGGSLDTSRTITLASSNNPEMTESILASDTRGALTLLELDTDKLADKSGGNLLIAPAGNITLDPTGNDVVPVTNYEINLGTLTKKYLTLHAAELWVETLVAQNTMATIGGRILVAPTTILTRDLLSSEISFYVKHHQMVTGDRVYLESSGKIEWVAISDDGVYQAEGDYKYRISRNLDGSGANDWFSGDAVLNTGTIDDGYIDIYSINSIRSGIQYGPTIVGNIRTGTTYSNIVEGWAIGNLNGLYGYGVDTYGAAFGKYIVNSSFLTVDPANGIRMVYKNNLTVDTVVAQWDINGDLTIGQVGTAKDNIFISAGVFALRVDTTNYITMTTAGLITVGLTSGPNTIIASTGIQFKNNTTVNLDITSAGVITIGPVGSSLDNILISSGALYFRVNTTNYMSMTTAGLITVGLSSGPNTVIQSTGIQLKNSSTVYLDMTSAGVVTVGATSGGNVYISASGIAIRDAATTYINLDTSGNATFGRTGGAYANVYWNATNYTLQFRTNTTVKSYIDTDGALVIKSNVSGINDRTAAVTWEDATPADIAMLSVYNTGALQGVELRCLSIAGKLSNSYLRAEAPSGYEAGSTIYAKSGTTYSWITVNSAKVDVTTDAFNLGTNSRPCSLTVSGPSIYWLSSGVQKTTGWFIPLTTELVNTYKWNLTGYSTSGAKTLMDLSVAPGSSSYGFGLPAGIIAVLLKVAIRDSGSYASSSCVIQFSNDSALDQGQAVRCNGLVNDQLTEVTLIIPCNADGDIYFQTYASGTTTLDVKLEVWGYWI